MGSISFHMTRSYIGELLDEIPMSLLAYGYLISTAGMHAMTRKPYQSIVVGLNGLLVAAGWAAYLVLGWYELFKVK